MSGDLRQASPLPKRDALEALTGLRFLAASYVVLYHFAGPALPEGVPDGWRHAVAHGYVGVNFFYLLSGFILAYNYAGRDGGTVTFRGSRREFWRNRFSRIYPLYLVAWLLAAPFVLAHWLGGGGSLLLGLAKVAVAGVVSLALVQAWIPGSNAWWNPPGWSISVEAFFYLVFPWLLPRLMNSRLSRVGLAVGVYALGLVAPVWFIGVGGTDLALAVVKYQPLLHLPTFMLGVLLAEWFDSSWRPRLLHARSLLGVIGLVAIVVCVRRPVGWNYPLIHNGLLSPAFAALILAVALGLPGLSGLLGSRPLVALGEASYGVYILQAPLWLIWRRFVGGLTPVADFAAFFVVLCVAALLAHRVVERPARRWLRAPRATEPTK